ncbi:NCS2 family permease [Enterococcus plantarum]|uniref:NCS2 family permease n=1 Tax=Enterococcus plantarum TaxID=1077675 RepID=UPI001A8FB0A1|nr:NCS2 family permease [Enterococcus plantarum]MBO0466991.1 NCS2 family permease [Enterococcus plantarum]
MFHWKKLKKEDIKREVLAGTTSFFAISYIIMVNTVILAEAGMPKELTIFGTIFISILGSILIGLVADAPIVLTTGMGVNSFFTYTLVLSLGLTWQQALAASFCAGIVYLLVAFTKLSKLFAEVVPKSLKTGITVGIGFFLVLIGLEKGHLIVRGEHTFLQLAPLDNGLTLLTLFSLILTVILFIKGVQGSFFIGIVVVTISANFFGMVQPAEHFSLSRIGNYSRIFLQLDFSAFFSKSFLLGVFALSMILIFESMGLLKGLMPDADEKKYLRAYRVTGVITLLSSILGTSPTVAAAESATGIEEGGETGITSITSGICFLLALLALPLLSYIPDSALAPAIIITGFLMIQQIKTVHFSDFSDYFPAILMIVLIPFTMNISDGMAFGFVAYPLTKWVGGKKSELSLPMWLISGLFLLYLIVNVLI